MDIGITRIGKVSRGGIPALATSLTTSGTWWAFAHATGPTAFRTLFGSRDIAYTIPQLLNRIRLEPLAAPIGRISTISSLELPRSEFPEVENWQIVIGTNTLAVQRHPMGKLEPDQVLKRNLGVWLDNTSGDDIVVDEDGNKTPSTHSRLYYLQTIFHYSSSITSPKFTTAGRSPVDLPCPMGL